MLKLKNKGFTLIELLVVVAIIGILAALLTANFITVQQRARDTQRKSDLRQIQSALEFYRADAGVYPDTSALYHCGPGYSLTSSDGLTTYMTTIPCSPLTKVPYVYAYNPSSDAYTLIACLENTSDPNADVNSGGSNNTTACPTPGTVSYTVTNP